MYKSIRILPFLNIDSVVNRFINHYLFVHNELAVNRIVKHYFKGFLILTNDDGTIV
ncbi:hypothetical protein Hanom_Chr10g00896091 [Helianthus anomalus]